MRRLGMSTDSLLYVDEVNLRGAMEQGTLKLALVDHNSLAGSLRGLEAAVVLVLDHHNDDGTLPLSTEKTIEPVGSCASLVAERGSIAIVFCSSENMITPSLP